jgi:hypothetical protein
LASAPAGRYNQEDASDGRAGDQAMPDQNTFTDFIRRIRAGDEQAAVAQQLGLDEEDGPQASRSA